MKKELLKIHTTYPHLHFVIEIGMVILKFQLESLDFICYMFSMKQNCVGQGGEDQEIFQYQDKMT